MKKETSTGREVSIDSAVAAKFRELYSLENLVSESMESVLKSAKFINDGYVANETYLALIRSSIPTIDRLTSYVKEFGENTDKEFLAQIPVYQRVRHLRKMVASVVEHYRIAYVFAEGGKGLSKKDDLTYMNYLIALTQLVETIGNQLIVKPSR